MQFMAFLKFIVDTTVVTWIIFTANDGMSGTLAEERSVLCTTKGLHKDIHARW